MESIFATWYSFIGNIFKELDLEITDFENFTRPFASIKHSLKKRSGYCSTDRKIVIHKPNFTIVG
jgi:hypothetical protein